jgi:hypothetical protein
MEVAPCGAVGGGRGVNRGPVLIAPRVAPSEPAGSDDPDDERLRDALRARRAWAERSALERFTPHVRRVLVRILGSTADLEDLTQEVFLRGLDRIAGLRQAWRCKAGSTGLR